MADTLWQGKSLKALASRTAEAIIEDLPIEAGAATTDHTIKDWLTSFFSDLAVLHTEKIRHAVTLASNHVGDDKRGDEVLRSRAVAMDVDERSMKVRLLNKFKQAFQDSAACICSGPFAVNLRSDNLSETRATHVEVVVDDVGNVDVVAQAAAESTKIVLSMGQRRLSTKLLNGMSAGDLDAGALRTLLKMAVHANPEDATEPSKPSAPLAEPVAAVPAEPKCGIRIPPSSAQPRERAGRFGSKEEGNLLDLSRAFAEPKGKLDSIVDPVSEEPAELEYNNVEKFEIFRKEVFRVPSRDRNCTVTANAQKEYLQSSDVEAWLKDMGVATGNKFATQMCKLKALKHFYDFVRTYPKMAAWKVAANIHGGKKLLLRKNPMAIFLLKNNGVTKAQYEQLTGIRVPVDTPYAVAIEDQANLISYWIVEIRMLRPRKNGSRLYAATSLRLKCCHLMAALNELEERLKALHLLPPTYLTYLRGMHAKQGPYRMVSPALDHFILWAIAQDPAVGQSQRAYTITEGDYQHRVNSLDYRMNFAWSTHKGAPP
jgi:hypothetical protein